MVLDLAWRNYSLWALVLSHEEWLVSVPGGATLVELIQDLLMLLVKEVIMCRNLLSVEWPLQAPPPARQVAYAHVHIPQIMLLHLLRLKVIYGKVLLLLFLYGSLVLLLNHLHPS